MTQDTIQVTINKSHLSTLGERLYVETVEFFRELVSNAYDADATQVYVRLGKDTIVVEDNGSGMNKKGLAQFFNIGSPEKQKHGLSPRFGRKRIGQFGIGKFAVLSAADEFQVESCKGQYICTVIFNNKDWQSDDSWQLPIKKEPATALHHQGTKVSLTRLKRNFSQAEVEKYLREVLPLRARKFAVFLNGQRVAPEEIIGRHIHFKHHTFYGQIEGEIIIAHNPKDVKQPGLECRVRGVLIKRSLFSIDPRRHGLQRITGWVEADFLTLTSARTEFVQDKPNYKLFYKLVQAELEKVLKDIKKDVDKKELAKMQSTLKSVLAMLRQALKENPDLAPAARTMARKKKAEKGKISAAVESIKMQATQKESTANAKPSKDQPNQAEQPKKELPPATVKKYFRVAKFGVTCGFAHLGGSGAEVISEGNIIYINQDHPLYLKLYAAKDVLALHLLRLITQEMVMMKKMRITARDAFDLQSRLLRDSLT